MVLVLIPTNRTLDGYSPTLKSQQRIDSRALPRLQSFADGFFDEFGRKLVVTEGARTRLRQNELWNDYQAYLARNRRPPWAALAARPYTSLHDEVLRGNATDLGSGIATFGTPAQKWAAENGPRHGVRPTGLKFPTREPWHFDIDITAGAGNPVTELEDEMSAVNEALMLGALTRVEKMLGDFTGAALPAIAAQANDEAVILAALDAREVDAKLYRHEGGAIAVGGGPRSGLWHEFSEMNEYLTWRRLGLIPYMEPEVVPVLAAHDWNVVRDAAKRQ